MTSPRLRALGLGGALALVLLLLGCVPVPPPLPAPPAPSTTEVDADEGDDAAWQDILAEVDGDASVIMTFETLPDDSDQLTWERMDVVIVEADEALIDAGVGYFDGDGGDAESIELYFYGNDHEAMWDILEPRFEDAPMLWTTVEVWESWRDEEPVLELTR